MMISQRTLCALGGALWLSLLAPVSAYAQSCVPKPANCPKTSDFGPRFHPVRHEMKMHNGTDFGCATGSSALSPVQGNVIFYGYSNSAGNWMKIRSGSTEYIYMHLFRNVVNLGDSVVAGQEVAKTGNTGVGTGPHLHFEVAANGNKIDPGTVLCDVPPSQVAGNPTSGGGGGGGAADVSVPEKIGLEGSFWDVLANVVGSRALNPSYPHQLSTLDEVRLFEELNYLEGVQLMVSLEKHQARARMLHNRAILNALRTEAYKRRQIDAQREAALKSGPAAP